MEERPFEDQDDLIINKLRERKEKFARTGECVDAIELNKPIDKYNVKSGDKQSTKNNQQSNAGALTAFDYTGEIFSSVKFDSFKFHAHYQ